MAPAGDFDLFATILEFYLQTVPFNSARTREYFGHEGIYYTETKTLFGAYSMRNYGPNASTRGPTTWPRYLESNGYIHYDYGGNGGGTGVAMMVLDHYMYTADEVALARYYPLVNLTLTFFHQHYKNRAADGKYLIWPAQALETYWCADTLDGPGGTWVPPYFHGIVGDPQADPNCIVNDHPTVAALHVLLDRVQHLPQSVVSEGDQALWATFASLLPDVPVRLAEGVPVVSPYASYPVNSKTHNSETPELYSVHPFRYYSVGRAAVSNRSILPALNCMVKPGVGGTCGNSRGNSGWNQGVMNAALLGLTDLATLWVIQRAKTAPATGYRFQGFAPHMQDYEPSADHYGNMNSALNWMLLQPADDANGTAIAFPSWPCAWDVDFKLKAPMNTTVEATLRNGDLVKFVVTPASRGDFVRVRNCTRNVYL
eukprot:m.92313 g.92313  ORF g.92313 m.92313 type:complete len:428 (+) comp12033_c0_seq1:1523-2806(+)